ncbi:hypothetical protein ACSAZL_12490 [Methanosarcina sp. T3]|uniref:hypothetical protein n=1 Tax=Methanosarcina sp. T3 TaxID=3439062 RepID=UPI003F85EC49
MSLTVAIISLIVTIMGILVAIVFGVPSYFSVYYAKKDHDKKNQDTASQESKIHERFNRAIDQLGSKRLGSF